MPDFDREDFLKRPTPYRAMELLRKALRSMDYDANPNLWALIYSQYVMFYEIGKVADEANNANQKLTVVLKDLAEDNEDVRLVSRPGYRSNLDEG